MSRCCVRGLAAVLSLSLWIHAPCLAGGRDPSPLPAAVLQAQGYIEPLVEPTSCLQGLYVITDPCTLRAIILESATYSLDRYVCRHALVQGPDVGIECPVVNVESLVLTGVACIVQVIRLDVNDPVATWLQWTQIPCATSYDVIRGALPGPRDGTTQVDLGTVICVANDVPHRTNDYTASTAGGPLDTEIPVPGRAFFYLARGVGTPFGIAPYGVSSSGSVEVPSGGDCPL